MLQDKTVSKPNSAAYSMHLFHICTIANDASHYAEMRRTFLEAGFAEACCRYTLLDNTGGNLHDPYRVLTAACTETTEPYLLFCHQDVRMDRGEGFDRLTRLLEELDARDPRWAIAGNAGVDVESGYILRITDPGTPDARRGDFQRSVQSLDENFLIVKTASRVGCSAELSGFHLYATDLCTHAIRRGFTCYVLDFHLTHLSTGKAAGTAFQQAKAGFRDHWNPFFHAHFLLTPCTGLFLSRHRVLRGILGRQSVIDWVASHPRRYALLLRLSMPFRALFGIKGE